MKQNKKTGQIYARTVGRDIKVISVNYKNFDLKRQ